MSSAVDISIVIPTFREQSNLERLLPQLFGILDRNVIRAEVVVIDDNSADGTDILCRELSAHHSLRLIVRRNERGLATAVLRGLKEAAGSIVVVMDADLSHPPEIVPILVRAVQSSDCDVAIGSRYVRGGSVDSKWSWFRRLNSRAATWLARGLTDAADPLSGFFAIAKSTLARAHSLNPLGYKILLELIVRCECQRIVEIPIHFQDRTLGNSKLSVKQQWLYVRHLFTLYRDRYFFRKLTVRQQNTERPQPPTRRRKAA